MSHVNCEKNAENAKAADVSVKRDVTGGSKPLGELEMVEILEGIARTGGPSARIQAIKTLLALNRGEEVAPTDDWDAIYGSDSNVTPLRKHAG